MFMLYYAFHIEWVIGLKVYVMMLELCLSSKFLDLNNENKDKCSWLFIKCIKNNVSKESKLNIVAYQK